MLRSLSLLPALLIVAALGAGCQAMKRMADTSSGAPAKPAEGVLVGPGGMTLYTFDRDPADASKSVCNGPCAVNWPPLLATPEAKGGGDWSVVSRDGGGRQWAYKGRPLYYWAKDQKTGDRTGDGLNGVWHLALP
jgi:predicted lipoprotein with Yx(FWY)xxD motif